MNVVVDTSVWSLALRRQQATLAPEAIELAELIREGRAEILGPIRQELLSGVRDKRQFELLRDRLREFPDLRLAPQDYEDAAACFNACRAKGIQGSNTDFLICAATMRRRLPILTTDADFSHFSRVLPIRLHSPRRSTGV